MAPKHAAKSSDGIAMTGAEKQSRNIKMAGGGVRPGAGRKKGRYMRVCKPPGGKKTVAGHVKRTKLK